MAVAVIGPVLSTTLSNSLAEKKHLDDATNRYHKWMKTWSLWEMIPRRAIVGDREDMDRGTCRYEKSKLFISGNHGDFQSLNVKILFEACFEEKTQSILIPNGG